MLVFVWCAGCRLTVTLLTDASCMLAMMVAPLGQGQGEGKTARFADTHVDIGMDTTHNTLHIAHQLLHMMHHA